MPDKCYNVGDVVWYAQCGQVNVEHPCPVCCGQLKATVILGNGDHVEVQCDYCGIGFEGPRGVVHDYEWIAEPRGRIIDQVKIEETAQGAIREYRSKHQCFEIEDLFDTKEEAQMRCEERMRKHEEEQNTRAEYIKKDQAKSYTWNAGYHMREAKSNRKRAEYHERMAVICKQKAKTTKGAAATKKKGREGK